VGNGSEKEGYIEEYFVEYIDILGRGENRENVER